MSRCNYCGKQNPESVLDRTFSRQDALSGDMTIRLLSRQRGLHHIVGDEEAAEHAAPAAHAGTPSRGVLAITGPEWLRCTFGYGVHFP